MTNKRTNIINHGIVSQNRKANFNYDIKDTLEAGLVLYGSEVKSLRAGMSNITEAFVQNKNREMILANSLITPLKTTNNYFTHEERRYRKLLLHKKQINKMIGLLNEKGATIVPLKLYFDNRGRAKVLLGIGYGKNKADKRESIKQKEWNRTKSRLLKNG